MRFLEREESYVAARDGRRCPSRGLGRRGRMTLGRTVALRFPACQATTCLEPYSVKKSHPVSDHIGVNIPNAFVGLCSEPGRRRAVLLARSTNTKAVNALRSTIREMRVHGPRYPGMASVVPSGENAPPPPKLSTLGGRTTLCCVPVCKSVRCTMQCDTQPASSHAKTCPLAATSAMPGGKLRITRLDVGSQISVAQGQSLGVRTSPSSTASPVGNQSVGKATAGPICC